MYRNLIFHEKFLEMRKLSLLNSKYTLLQLQLQNVMNNASLNECHLTNIFRKFPSQVSFHLFKF